MSAAGSRDSPGAIHHLHGDGLGRLEAPPEGGAWHRPGTRGPPIKIPEAVDVRKKDVGAIAEEIGPGAEGHEGDGRARCLELVQGHPNRALVEIVVEAHEERARRLPVHPANLA